MDALKSCSHAIHGRSVVALHHLGTCGDGLRQAAEEDVLVERRQPLRDGHVGCEQPLADVALIDESAGQHAQLQLAAIGAARGGAPERCAKVLEHRLACLRAQDSLGEHLVEVDLEGGSHRRVDGD